MKTKNYIRNYARYATLKKSFLMVYIETYGCYEIIKIKPIYNENLDPVEIFNYKKKMIAKFNYVL